MKRSSYLVILFLAVQIGSLHAETLRRDIRGFSPGMDMAAINANAAEEGCQMSVNTRPSVRATAVPGLEYHCRMQDDMQDVVLNVGQSSGKLLAVETEINSK
jgi:hypothetical protein